MSLTELTAFETAYQVLHPLSGAARRRALQWLADALGEAKLLTSSHTLNGAASQPAAAALTRRPRKSQVSTPTRGTKPKATSGTRGRQRKSVVDTGSRQYRRMPDPDEVMAAYDQIGTITGLADHFHVPTYTVNSWARRLRNDGYQIGRPR